MMDATIFRKAMGTFATGVTIITTPDKEGVHGMTANAFTSVSLDPPLILVSVNKKARTHETIQEAKRFGVNILRYDQEALSTHFAGRPSEEVNQSLKYTWYEDIPLLEDCLTQIACRLWAQYDGGDHTLFLGRVVDLKLYEGEPLLYYASAYRQLGK